MMIRVQDETRSRDFYSKAFGLELAERVEFPDFALIYLRNDENDFELELTVNKGRTTPYALGDGYGHLALVVSDLGREHERLQLSGFQPKDIKQLDVNGAPFGRFFFVDDPDGYKIEVIERRGRFL